MVKNIIIIALAVINGTLIYAFLQRQQGYPQPAQVRPSQPIRIDAGKRNTAEDQVPALAQDVGDTFTQDSYEDLTNELRNRGLPEDLVKQMVLSAINRDFLLDTRMRRTDTPYWKKPERDPHQATVDELDLEEQKRQLLLEIFGTEIVDDPLFEDLFRPLNDRLALLSSDTQIALDALIRSKRAQTLGVRGPGMLREDRVAMRDSSVDLDQAIQELLTEDEYLEYQLRNSPLASAMRRTMDGFDYSEQEFRDIFGIRNASTMADVRQIGGGREEHAAAVQANNEQLRDYLGEARYQEYERLQDPVFRSLQSIGERYGSSESELIEVYEISSAMATQTREIARNGDLPRQEARKRMEEIDQQAFAEIIEVVGEEAAESIRQNTRRFAYRPRPPRR